MRMIHCSYLQKEAEGLENQPFLGPIGQEIFDKVSQEGWNAWREMQTKIINEYRLDLSESQGRETLMTQMRAFLKLDDKAEQGVLSVGTPN